MIKYLAKEWKSKPRFVLGIMTGTSFDAIDISLIKVESRHKIEVLNNYSENFPEEYKSIVNDLITKKKSVKFISQFRNYYSKLIIKAIKNFYSIKKIDFNTIDAISIHGQTIWHNPNPEDFNGMSISSTWQILNPSLISKELDKIVISDFRGGDLVYGGQGAPLVPIFDFNFFKNKRKDVICLNIGGISNITYISKEATVFDILAFDTGPGNVLIDKAAKNFFKAEYDNNGTFAKSGKLNEIIFNRLKNIDYINEKPPKSTGRELFNNNLFNELVAIKKENKVNSVDFIHTLSYFTSYSIFINIQNFASNEGVLYYSGGGSKNSFIINSLKKLLPKYTLLDTDSIHISSTYKEAIAFAYIGWRTMAGLPSSLKSVTGSYKETILGSITFP
jgi:anhydro-N-acetylmuramic acid kinase